MSIAVALPLLAGCGGGSAADAPASEAKKAAKPVDAEQFVDDLLTALDCPTRTPWGSSDPNIALNYNCDDGSQEFVYFFSTEGDQRAWMSRALGNPNDATPLIAGPGWAVRTGSTVREAAAVNYGGTILQ
jgi:hypothetical protein